MPQSLNPYSPLCRQRVFHQHHPRLFYEYCYFCVEPKSHNAAQWKGQLWTDRLTGDMYGVYKQLETSLLAWLSESAVQTGFIWPEAAITKGHDLRKSKEPVEEKPLEVQSEDSVFEESQEKDGQPLSSPTNDESHQSKTMSVSSDLLISLAETTVGKVQVPVQILLTVGRMIEIRRTCAYSLVEVGGIDNMTLLHGHEKFVSILETVFRILKNSLQADLTANYTSTTKLSTDCAIKDAGIKFDGRRASKAENIDSSLPHRRPTPIIQLKEGSNELRMSLMAFCLFEDIATIQGWLQCTLGILEDNTQDSIEASLATIAAIEIVHKREQALLSEFSDHCNLQRPYESIARMLVHSEHLKKLKEPSKTSCLDQFEANVKRGTFILASTAQTFKKFAYLGVVPRLAIPEPVETLTLRSGSIAPSEIFEHEYMDINEDEDEILSKYIIELDLYAHYQEDPLFKKGDSCYPAQDYLVKGLLAFRSNGILSLSLVFAARIFLDLQEKYGDGLTTRDDELHDIAGYIQSSINLVRWFRTESRVMIMGWREENYRDVMELEGKAELIQFHVFKIYKEKVCRLRQLLWGRCSDKWAEDRQVRGDLQSDKSLSEHTSMMQQSSMRMIEDFRSRKSPGRGCSRVATEMKENIKRTSDLEYVPKSVRQTSKEYPLTRVIAKPSEDLLTSRNPIFCGIAALGLLCEKETLGLALCQYHPIVLFFAHLYIEITQSTSIPKSTWPEMQYLIDTHLGQISVRWGSSSSAEALLRLEQHMDPKMGPAYDPAQLSLEFRSYLHSDESGASPLTVLEYLLRQDENGYTALGRKKSPKMSPIHFLQSVLDILPSELRQIQFDYIDVVYKCYDICMQIAKTIKDKMAIEYKLEDDQGAPSGYYDMIWGLLKDAKDLEHMMENGVETGQTGQQYVTAADVIERYFEGGTKPSWKAVRQEHTYRVRSHDLTSYLKHKGDEYQKRISELQGQAWARPR